MRHARKNIHYPKLYRSYWHFKLCKPKNSVHYRNYFSAQPNSGAGIGHQCANWIAGYWFAKQFDLRFAHSPFASEKWEMLLGFGQNEIHVEELINQDGYKKVNLPLFDEQNAREVSLCQKIIDSYHDKKVVFMAEQDQFYRDQYGVMNDLKDKFYNAFSRKNDRLRYSSDHFNIALHIRRGDILGGRGTINSNLSMRWQHERYFEKVLSLVLNGLKINKPIFIYLFSQGSLLDFSAFVQFNNMHFCLDMNEQDAFVHMIFADLLISSKSSFSYKPAILWTARMTFSSNPGNKLLAKSKLLFLY